MAVITVSGFLFFLIDPNVAHYKIRNPFSMTKHAPFRAFRDLDNNDLICGDCL